MPPTAAKKPGRNEPCWCGSGKKYKACHLLIEENERQAKRKLYQAQDTLMPKIIEAAQGVPEAFPQAFALFWKDQYSIDQMSELDDLEDRGAERFLTWFAFDHPLEDGKTLVETLAGKAEANEDTGEFTLDQQEKELLLSWQSIRLRPYLVKEIYKGQGMLLEDMLSHEQVTVEDNAASRFVELDEVVIAHIVPAADKFFFAGSAAHLTPDTAEPLVSFVELHLADVRRSQADASWDHLLRDRSYILNQFVQQLPREEPDPTIFDQILLRTRTALQLTGDSINQMIGRDKGKGEEDKDAKSE